MIEILPKLFDHDNHKCNGRCCNQTICVYSLCERNHVILNGNCNVPVIKDGESS